jgi:diguanylate cyclase (GGDEF)-like protein/PAS domain S-box-containing protein
VGNPRPLRGVSAAEEALCMSEQRLREILETAPVAFMSTDAEGLIVDWNAEAELLFGWSRSEALGRTLAQAILPHPVRGAYEHELAELLETDDSKPASRHPELTVVGKDGREFPVDMTISRVPAGDSNLFRLYARDISAERRADEGRRYAEEQLVYQALHDPLTGLPNRTLLFDRVGRALALADRHGSIAAVLYADIDNFTLVNNSFGHQVGDELLVHVARRLQDVLRGGGAAALLNGDTLARVDGDEFVVLCESLASERDAIGIAERINATVAEPFAIAGERLFVTLSIGIALTSASASPGSLIRDADAATHRAKERGGARYELFDPETRARMLNRIRKENELRDAIEHEQLRLFYQPIVSVLDGGIVGAEALLRWDHPQHGLLPPSEFIPLAEETGLIVPFGRWVLQQAWAQLARWHATLGFGSPLHVSVNVSARQLVDEELVRLVTELLKQNPLQPSQLVLEVTESILLNDTDTRVAVLRHLQALGLRLALDDFGTGYSSLGYLRRLPFNVLKLDRSFISGLDQTTTDPQIAAAVIEMARALRMTVVAEGVETHEQLDCLRRLGCHFAQGYHFAAPMPAEMLSLLLRDIASERAGLPIGPGIRLVDGEIQLSRLRRRD